MERTLKLNGLKYSETIVLFKVCNTAKKDLLLIGLVASVILVAGCTQNQIQTQYVCPDGIIVSDVKQCELSQTQNQASKSTEVTINEPSSEENQCLQDVNVKIINWKLKFPSGTTIDIVDRSSFANREDINNWLKLYSSILGKSINCDDSLLASVFYFCKDLANLNNSTSSEGKIAFGVSLRVEGPTEGSIPAMFPLLCDSEGKLMQNSKDYS